MKEIRFRGKDYVFVGDELSDGGAIAVKDDYESGKCSYAHLFKNGDIVRFQQEIGTISDIEVVGQYIAPEPTISGFVNMLTDPSWKGS